jgi:1-acyl-sn-glycerol-3-phosphate acyltransferase
MRGWRAAWRLLRALVHALHGLAIVLLVFPRLDPAARRDRVRWWARRMLDCLGIGLEVRGDFKAGAKMIVANHVSWVDILVVHAVHPEARFVSKAEARGWPLISRLVDAGGTLYIERERKRDAMRVVHRCADALRAGDTVAVFPEGTTGPGHDLLPFHANLLQAAIAVSAPLQPVALRYSDPGHAVSPAALWVGTTTLAGTLRRLVSANGLVAHLRILPARGTAHADRRRLAEAVRIEIGESLAALDLQHRPT